MKKMKKKTEKKYILRHPETKSYVLSKRDTITADAERNDATVFSKKRLDDLLFLEGSVGMPRLHKKLLNGLDARVIWASYERCYRCTDRAGEENLEKEGYDIIQVDLEDFETIEVTVTTTTVVA